jgi:predicted ferric reductase
MFEIFLKAHQLEALLVMALLFWHILLRYRSAIPFPAAGLLLWSFGRVLWLLQLMRHRGHKLSSKINHFYNADGTVAAVRLELQLQKNLHIDPGQYLYLYLLDMERFQTHPFMITWWEDGMDNDKEAKSYRNYRSTAAKTLSFLIEPQSGLTSKLSTRISVQNVAFDGPYGQSLQLYKYETVFLVAKGIGIAGILPYMLYLTQRQQEIDEYRLGLMTRKVEAHWILDNNSQDEWISDYIARLQGMEKKVRNPHLIYSANILRRKYCLFGFIALHQAFLRNDEQPIR